MDQLQCGKKNDDGSLKLSETLGNNHVIVDTSTYPLVQNGERIADNIKLIEDGSSLIWTYKNSFTSDDDLRTISDKFVIVEIDGSYYVGFDYVSIDKKVTNEAEYKNVDADGYYSDWIVKVTPAKKQVWARVFAEDLGTIGDWDFNDVVFDVTKDNKVVLQAAGGTLPLYLVWKDEKKEVHEAFGVPTTTMVNTHASSNGVDGKTPVTLWSNFYEDASAIKIYVVENGEEREITAITGQPAAKFAVKEAIDWQVEGVKITGKYPNFSKYVKDTSYEAIWYLDNTWYLNGDE